MITAPTFPIQSGSSELDTIADAMADPWFELDTESAAAVLSVIDTARAAGHPQDPFTLALLALVDVLRRQLIQTDDGETDRAVDDGQECDDAEERRVA